MAALLNVEIKARTDAPERVRAQLLSWQARHGGDDHQVDTYYRCPEGRLKLRCGNVENALIYYRRDDQGGPKRSDIVLEHLAPEHDLGAVLEAALGIRIVVDKHRSIYFIDNVKFHVDHVEGLGDFVEIEAIDDDGSRGAARLERQCREYMDRLGIRAEDLVATSYSDLLAAAAG